MGLDNFAVAAGWVGMDFACVGEWFLGSILFLYLLFPLLQRALRKAPVLTWAVALLVCIPLHMQGWDNGLVAVHIPEFLFGMTFLTLKDQIKAILAPVLVLGLADLPVDEKLLCSMFSALIFIGLAAAAAPLLDKPLPRAVCAKAAKLSYAVFLTHHVIIQRLVRGFDLAALSRRDTAILFCVYLLGSPTPRPVYSGSSTACGRTGKNSSVKIPIRCLPKQRIFCHSTRHKPLYKIGWYGIIQSKYVCRTAANAPGKKEVWKGEFLHV